MKTSITIASSLVAIFTVAILLNPTNVLATTQIPDDISTTITPINEEISLEKTVTTMYIPQDNTLPWGAVKGTVSDPAERYPVIIQFFKGEDPVHVAQVDVKGDDTYEYKFRVFSMDDSGQRTDIFEGEYTVKIFKVINNDIQTA